MIYDICTITWRRSFCFSNQNLNIYQLTDFDLYGSRKQKKQVPELAGDPEVPGTCRSRQKWVPQAWKDAEQEGGKMQSAPPLASSDQRRAAKFDDAAKIGGGGGRSGGRGTAGGDVGGGGSGGEGTQKKGAAGEGRDLVYDLLAVVVHRGSAYSGHYHALIRDCLQEVREMRGAVLSTLARQMSSLRQRAGDKVGQL